MRSPQMTIQEWNNFLQDAWGNPNISSWKNCVLEEAKARGWIVDNSMPDEPDRIRDFADEEIERFVQSYSKSINEIDFNKNNVMKVLLKNRAWEPQKTALEKAREIVLKDGFHNMAIKVKDLYEQAISEQQAEIDLLKKQIEGKCDGF